MSVVREYSYNVPVIRNGVETQRTIVHKRLVKIPKVLPENVKQRILQMRQDGNSIAKIVSETKEEFPEHVEAITTHRIKKLLSDN